MSRAGMQKMVYNRTPYVRNPNIIARTKWGGQFGKSVSDGLGLQSPESLTAEEEKSRTDQKILAQYFKYFACKRPDVACLPAHYKV